MQKWLWGEITSFRTYAPPTNPESDENMDFLYFVVAAGEYCFEADNGKAVIEMCEVMNGIGEDTGADIDVDVEDDKDESTQDTSGDTKSESKKSYGFHVIDQTDRNNILVISMIKGQLSLKQSTKAADCRAYAELIFNEIDAPIEDLAKSDGNTSLIQEWKNTKEDVQVYLNNAKKGARAAPRTFSG